MTIKLMQIEVQVNNGSAVVISYFACTSGSTGPQFSAKQYLSFRTNIDSTT
jgi:hypothetical protein